MFSAFRCWRLYSCIRLTWQSKMESGSRLAGGLLQVVPREDDLVLTLDLAGGSLHGLVVHEFLQLLQLGGVGLEAVTDGLLQQMGQARVEQSSQRR